MTYLHRYPLEHFLVKLTLGKFFDIVLSAPWSMPTSLLSHFTGIHLWIPFYFGVLFFPFYIPAFSSVQSLSRVWLFATPWIAALQASLSITNSRSSLRLTSIESVMPSSHLILCHPLSSCLQSLPLSESSNESTLCMRWPKYWSFSFITIPSKEIPGLISFRMDWLDLAVQGTLKSLLQHHSSKPLILWHSAFFTVQLSHPYMTTGKSIALTRRTFVGKVKSYSYINTGKEDHILSLSFSVFLEGREWKING